MLYETSFMTRRGNTCRIEIITNGDYSTEYRGQLLASEEPFEMETDDGTEIDVVLRKTTGTLRLIMTSETLVYDIMPSTPLGTSVRIIMEDAGSGEESLKFAGYIEMGEYSQPWTGAPYEQEFPVVDVIGSMEYVRVPLREGVYMGMSYAVGRCLYECLSTFAIRGEEQVKEFLFVGGGTTEVSRKILPALVPWEWMMENDAVENATTGKTDAVRGMTWYDALERIFKSECLTVWIEGEVMCFRFHGLSPASGSSFFYYEMFLWDAIKDGTYAAYKTGHATKSLRFDALVEVEGDGGQTSVLPPCGVMTVKESLQKRSIYELDASCLTHTMIFAISETSGKDTFSFSSQTTQRGVTVKRYTKNDGGYEELTGNSMPPGFILSENGTDAEIVGGMLFSTSSYEDRVKEAAIPEPSGTGIVMVPGSESREPYDNYTCGIEILSTVGVSGDTDGCLRLSGGFHVIQCSTDGSTQNFIKYYMNDNPTNGQGSYQYGTILQVNLVAYAEDTTGDLVSYTYEAGSGWVREDSLYMNEWIFMSTGDMLTNYISDGHYASVRGYNASAQGTTYSVGYDSDKVFRTSVRFHYGDGGNFFIPLDGLPSGHYSIRVRIYASRYPQGTFSGGNVAQSNAYWFTDHKVLVMLHDLKIEWCPMVISGTLPNFGSSGSGEYYYSSLTYAPQSENRVHVCTNSGNGEDVEVTLDTWGDDEGDGKKKWGNTVQPDLCDMSRFDAASLQMSQERVIIDVEEAYLQEQEADRSASDYNVADVCDAKDYYTYVPGVRSKYFVRQGGTWSAKTETGRRRFVEFH